MSEVPRDPPHGAVVVVYRRRDWQPEFLLLHRSASGPDFAGEWAWGPPGGTREEGGTIDQCAARELREETGLSLPLRRIASGSPDWVVYVAEASSDRAPCLSAEHDRHTWLPYADALPRVTPAIVRAQFLGAARVVLGEKANP